MFLDPWEETAQNVSVQNMPAPAATNDVQASIRTHVSDAAPVPVHWENKLRGDMDCDMTLVMLEEIRGGHYRKICRVTLYSTKKCNRVKIEIYVYCWIISCVNCVYIFLHATHDRRNLPKKVFEYRVDETENKKLREGF